MQPVFIAVAGGSGSGKSWLARRLRRLLAGRGGLLALDDFYRDLSSRPAEAQGRVNFDDPAALDWDLLQATLAAIRRGERVRLPRYAYATHTRTWRSRRWEPRPVVLLEGLWALRWSWLRRQCAYAIYCEAAEALRLARRLARDVRERGQSAAAVRRQWEKEVLPMHVRHVAPQLRWADRVITSPVTDQAWRELVACLNRLGFPVAAGGRTVSGELFGVR